MKFNWGHGIFTFYVLFVAILVLVVIKSRTFDNSLVDENYYARDINYQQEYDRKLNSSSLVEPLRLETTEDGYELRFPVDATGKIGGTLHLYRASTKNGDRRLPLTVGEAGAMPLPLAGLTPGHYAAIVEWSANGVGYYDELDLYVNP